MLDGSKKRQNKPMDQSDRLKLTMWLEIANPDSCILKQLTCRRHSSGSAVRLLVRKGANPTNEASNFLFHSKSTTANRRWGFVSVQFSNKFGCCTSPSKVCEFSLSKEHLSKRTWRLVSAQVVGCCTYEKPKNRDSAWVGNNNLICLTITTS